MPVDTAGRWYGAEVDDTARSGLASQTITATGNSAAFNAQDIAALNAKPYVGGATGTSPSIVFTLQHSEDGTNWFTVGSALPAMTGVVAAGAVAEEFLTEDYGQLRWSWTVTGTTPSFTGIGINTTIKKVGDA